MGLSDKIFVSLHVILPQIRPRGYKTFFMLNSVEHKILNAHKYNQEIRILLGSDKPKKLKCYFFSLINVKNANNCWHFNIYEQEKFLARLS